MPDWARRVSRRLGPLAIPPKRRDEIVREMAGFLEDRYEERLSLGESPRAALRGAMASAGRWPDLAREIERVEGQMTRRWKTMWLPGLAVSVAAQGLVVALAVLGAAGAAWSRQQGGTRFERLIVAVFPLAPWLVFFPMGVARILSEDIPTSEKLLVVLVGGLNWVIVPALALVLGALPVLHRSEATARPA